MAAPPPPPPALIETAKVPSQRFLQALGFVLSQEGREYHDRYGRGDPGGPTKFGITQRTLGDYRRRYSDDSLPRRVRDLSEHQATQIYYRQFWRDTGARAMRGPIGPAFFDTAVHSGPATAYRLLRASGGDAGRLLELRSQHLRGLPHARSNPGWARRITALRTALGLSTSSPGD